MSQKKVLFFFYFFDECLITISLYLKVVYICFLKMMSDLLMIMLVNPLMLPKESLHGFMFLEEIGLINQIKTITITKC